METPTFTDSEAKERFVFAQETARRLKAFGDRLHGLACVDAEANADGSVALRVEYFNTDATREGSGDANRLWEFAADMGLLGVDEVQAFGRGAFGPVEHLTLY